VDRIELAALGRIPLVLTGPPEGPMQRVLMAAQAQAGQAFVGLAQVENAAIGRQLVLAGVCLMVEVAAVVKAELAAGIAAAVPISDLRIQRYLARARGRGGSDAVARLVSLMRDCVADMVREGAWPSARVLDASLSAAAAYGAEAAG
jgi:LysR family transcriptional regulator, nitrogen assimilation regulatory protein